MSQKGAVRPAVARARALGALGTLRKLSAVWEACGADCEALQGALAGGCGVTAKELAHVERMAERWRSLDRRLRLVLVKHARTQCAGIALWFSIADPNHRVDKITPHTINLVSDLWEAEYGYRPNIVLFPKAAR